MQGNEVVDLQKYREADADTGDDQYAEPQYLPEGTKLLLGQYTIDGYLNCGGFGITYFASDSLNRRVVIKECFPSELAYRSGVAMVARSPKFKEELTSITQHFVREAHRLANVRHDNIVHVHQIFEENDTAYMAMDYIDGPDLLDVLEAGGKKFSPNAVQDLVRKMLGAIKYVHDRGMLHRDISPDNILIDPRGEPVLIDFGAAREHAQKTQRAMSKLKFVKDGYSPQEFYIAGSEQGTWSDLYSFAATIYHVITGEPPIDGQARLAALAAKQKDPYTPLAERAKGYSSRFLKALDQALHVIPDRRIQTADEWIAILDAERSSAAKAISKPITAVMESLSAMETFAPKSQSSKKPLLAAGVGVLALLVGAGVVFTQMGGDNTEIAAPLAPAASDVTVVDAAPAATRGTERQPTVSFEASGTSDAVASADTSAAAFDPVTVQDAPEPILVPDVDVVAVVPSIDPVATPTPSETVVADEPALQPEDFRPQLATSATVRPAARPLQTPEQAGTLAAPVLTAADIPDVGRVGASFDAPDTVAVGVIGTPTSSPDRLAFIEQLPTVEPALPWAFSLDALPPQASAQVVVETAETLPSAENAPEVFLAPTPKLSRDFDVAALPPANAEPRVITDTTPPQVFVPKGQVLANQVVYAHWDVRMPFESVTERVRAANTLTILKVAPDADLSVAGEWISEGVIIYSFNGEKLLPDTPLSVHVLKSLAIDPDGHARSTVRYRDPVKGVLDRALLAVPVLRETGLADGTVLHTSMQNGSWITTVASVGDGTNGLEDGDILKLESQTGIEFATHEDISRALNNLAARGVGSADVTVLRNGTRQNVTWRLAREG